MGSRKIIAIILVIIGAGMLFFSDYIANQVASGQAQIQRAQSQVNTVNRAFDSNSQTRGMGKIFTGSAQNKIDEGRAEVAYYGSLSQKVQILGIVFIVIGVVLFFTGRRKQ